MKVNSHEIEITCCLLGIVDSRLGYGITFVGLLITISTKDMHQINVEVKENR